MAKLSSSGYTAPGLLSSTDPVLPLIIQMLKDDQTLAVKPNGLSMFPFFHGERDTLYIGKPVFPLRKGDIALYRRDNGMFVVHRIYKVKNSGSSVKEGSARKVYYMLGDHQTEIEGPLEESTIYGVVKEYLRKDKKIDCRTDRTYNLLWRLWMFIRPLRPVILKIKTLIKP